MRRTGPLRIAALALIALLIGPGELLGTGCSSCRTGASPAMGCQQGHGPAFHPDCCGGGAARAAGVAGCCASPGEPSAAGQSAVAPQPPSAMASCPAPAADATDRPARPERARRPEDPPRLARVDLYTLHATLLI